MELFIPSLLTIVLGGVVFAFLLPKFSLYVLGVMSIALFVIGIHQHWKMFPYEYSMSESRQILSDYAPFITLLVTILGLIMMALQLTGGSGGSGAGIMAALPALPAMPEMPAMPAMPEMPALNIPKMPTIADMGMARPANNRGANANAGKNKGIMGMNFGGNNGKRNNIASNSFKVT
jgi:hypothetical protein